MQRRQPIFAAIDPAIVSSGLMPDVDDVLTPLWMEADGVEFIAGSVRHRKENTRLVKPDTGIGRGLGQQVMSDGSSVMWSAIGQKIFRFDGFSVQELAQLVGNPYINFTFYGDWAFLNRGYGQVQRWSGTAFDTFAEMPVNFPKLMKFLSYLVAIGIGSKGVGVGWSDANDVSKWAPSRENTAGALYLDDMDSKLVTAMPLGLYLACYSASAMALVGFIGAPFYFGKKNSMRGIGAVGPEAVTMMGATNYGMSRQGPWVTDGQMYQYIDTGRIHKYFQDNVNWNAARKTIVARNDILRTIEFHLPVRGSNELNESWSYDPETYSWSEIPTISAFSDPMLFNFPLAITPTGEIVKLGSRDYNLNSLRLVTKPLVMQVLSSAGYTDVHFENRVDEVELFLKDAQGVQMRVGSSKHPAGPITWSTYIPVNDDQTTYLVPAGVPDGVYWHLEFTNTGEAEAVVSGGDNVVENGEQVVAVLGESAWRLDLQGFLLFGTITGGKE